MYERFLGEEDANREGFPQSLKKSQVMPKPGVYKPDLSDIRLTYQKVFSNQDPSLEGQLREDAPTLT